MARRMITMLVAVALFIAAIGFFKFQQIQAAIKGGGFSPPPEAVTTVVAHQDTWPGVLTAIGTVEAVQGVTVSADLPGMVAKINFESGQSVGKGAVLVELDTRQERAQLAAAEAQRDLAKLNLDRAKGLQAKQRHRAVRVRPGATPRSKQAEASVGEIHATIERKTDPRAVRGHARHPPGQPRPVPRGRRPDRAAPVARSDLRELLACRSRTCGRIRVGDERPRARRQHRDAARRRATSPPSTRSSTRPRATSRCRPRFRNPSGAAAPGHVRASVRGRRRAPEHRHRAAGVGDQLRAVRQLGLRASRT